MNNSDFETSGIRKMIIKITGIDIFKIEQYEIDMLNEKEHHPVIIHFTSASYPDLAYQTAMTQAEFNRLCESDLTRFKAYFEKIALNANEGQRL
ncbi:hypothetical protein Dfri01_22010 [Dyadobacter frigoris]|uniref:hypothetical protein n=1 Tax=Dyadobacter frigoris TaxID=2576211 RepID=UPI0024A0D2D8|nr:hypothetical protein [Dyadobacter frigoris]GLU52740.1 hypothetical protein Dfri01_22010 [Dyadobacter frigoris]